MTPETEIAKQIAPEIMQNIWPVIYSAGFAGLVCLILLLFLYKILTKHIEAQTRNSLMLEEVGKDLKDIAASLHDLEKYIERRQR